AGVVLVAARLVNGALAAPFGLERLHRHAVRLDAAVATALADEIIDDDALVRIGKRAALAAAAFFGGAGLIVNEHAQTGDGRQFALDRVEFVAVMHGQTARPLSVLRVFPGLIGDDDNSFGALGRYLSSDLGHSQPAIIGLPAGHRHSVVEQDFVGHVHAGRDPGADREVAGMVISAIAEILEHVSAV